MKLPTILESRSGIFAKGKTLYAGIRVGVSVCLLLALFIPVAMVVAQAGGYSIPWWTVDNGGATSSTGGTYRLNGTSGQPDAGQLSGGSYTLYGGFWNMAVPTPTPSDEQGGDPDILPNTGFAQGRVTWLSSQPEEKVYEPMSDLWMEIPALGLRMDIVGVPVTNGAWDVSWLGEEAGWLENSAYPTWNGNSVLTGHVWNADNTPGPFVNLRTLQWGDQVIIHGWDKQYVYEIRSVQQVESDAVSSVMQHKDTPWVTLLTCHAWDEESGTYRYRQVVQAVLMEVK